MSKNKKDNRVRSTIIFPIEEIAVGVEKMTNKKIKTKRTIEIKCWYREEEIKSKSKLISYIKSVNKNKNEKRSR